MNLLMASVFLLAILAFQPTLIYGSKSFISKGNGKKFHGSSSLESSADADLVNSAKLVMSMDSGDVLVRSARGAAADTTGSVVSNTADANTSAAAATTTNTGKRGKNNHNNNNKKLNKNITPESGPHTNGRKHFDKKLGGSALNQDHQQQHHMGHNNHNNNNSNNKGKQRQILKSQQHQSNGKRSGIKSKSENADKSKPDNGKTKSTCRYAKSTWSECDAKSNMRTRTLTLKKGEPNCLPTRTMQKKCKKPCRYDRGAWSECLNGQMTRQDTLKTTGGSINNNESACEAARTVNKKCVGANKQGGKSNNERKNKFKASRRAPPQA